MTSKVWMLGGTLGLLALGGGVGYAVGARGTEPHAEGPRSAAVATFAGGSIDADAVRARIQAAYSGPWRSPVRSWGMYWWRTLPSPTARFTYIPSSTTKT